VLGERPDHDVEGSVQREGGPDRLDVSKRIAAQQATTNRSAGMRNTCASSPALNCDTVTSRRAVRPNRKYMT
jgi:hypothetical protein